MGHWPKRIYTFRPIDNIISFAAHATFFRRGDSRTLLLVWIHKESQVKQKKPLYKKSYDMSQIYINVRNIIVGFSLIFLVSGHSSLYRTKDLRKKEITREQNPPKTEIL